MKTLYLRVSSIKQGFQGNLSSAPGGQISAEWRFMENDVHGSQRYRPLLGLEIPLALRGRLEVAYLASKQSRDNNANDEVVGRLGGPDGVLGLQVNGSTAVHGLRVNEKAEIPSV